MKQQRRASAFSLIEISIVILIIGILVAGITQSSRLITQAKISTARTLTQSSPASSVKGLSLWLESTSDASIVISGTRPTGDIDDQSTILSWLDINPQAINKANATASGTPVYRTNAINGLPAVCFNNATTCGGGGVTNFFTAANFTNLSTVGTVFAVVKLPSTLAAEPILSKRPIGSGFAAAGNFQLNTNASGNWQFCDGATTNSSNVSCNYTSTGTAATASTAYVVALVYNASSTVTAGQTTTAISFFQNGVGYGQVNTTSTPAQVTDSLLIGKTSTSDTAVYFKGFIGELIVYDRSLKKEERQSIEAYLGKKWDIKIDFSNTTY